MKTTEPVRVSGWTALAVGAGLQAIILAAAGTPWLGIAGALAAQLLLSIGGLEWARNRVSPVPRDGVGLPPPTTYRNDDGRFDVGGAVGLLVVAILVIVLVKLAVGL